jgi:hypothetical protein
MKQKSDNSDYVGEIDELFSLLNDEFLQKLNQEGLTDFQMPSFVIFIFYYAFTYV